MTTALVLAMLVIRRSGMCSHAHIGGDGGPATSPDAILGHGLRVVG
jgi:hypothetical protein